MLREGGQRALSQREAATRGTLVGLGTGSICGLLSGFISLASWTSDVSSGVAGGVQGAILGAVVGVIVSIIGMLVGVGLYLSVSRLIVSGVWIGAIGAGTTAAALVGLISCGEDLTFALLTPASFVIGSRTALLLLPSWSD